MTTISALRKGLATNLDAISGLRVTDYVPDDPKPPVAVVMPPKITYDRAFGRGLDEYEFTIMVIVGRMSDRAAQATLDGYCNPTGLTSVKTALEADRTLAGASSDLRVTDMRGITSLSIADNTYLAAEFTVTAYAH